HYVLFPLPPAGTQTMAVACGACEKELEFRVDSLARRKARRIRLAAISLVFLTLSLTLGIAISPTLGPGKLGWLWLGFVLGLFGSIYGFWLALQFCGVTLIRGARGHNASPFLAKDILVRYRRSGQMEGIVRAVPKAPDARKTHR